MTSNPEWFTTRPDGTIAYAENPPKKYQDIYPINFDNAPETIYAEVLRIVQYWISHGITVFRVDNPHTKPVDFWEWLIAEVHKTTPEAMFLAEAFTRPAMMHELAKAGFTQSYTYFTWRNAKQEIIDYCVELVDASEYMRPSFWVNTPDILPFALQRRDPATFALRAVLAATLSPTWGVYAGYELYEHEVLAPGREEYLNSEKFQLRPRDFETALATGQSLEPFLGSLNRIRKAHPSLQRMKGLWFHGVDNDNLLVYSRHDEVSGRHDPRGRRTELGRHPLRYHRPVAAGARTGVGRRVRRLRRDSVATRTDGDSSTPSSSTRRWRWHTCSPSSTGELMLEPPATDFRSARQLPADPQWYQRAVFYEVLVRAFYDSERATAPATCGV